MGPNVKKYSVKSILHIHQMIDMKCHMVYHRHNLTKSHYMSYIMILVQGRSERATTSQARASGASGASGGAKCQKVLGEIHSPYPSDDRYEVP